MNPEDYIASFSFDQRLAPYDIQGSVAHVSMLARKKIIPAGDARHIIAGLHAIEKDLKRGWKLSKAEDIHFAIESELIRRIGKVGKRMHTARSRNDQVVLDLKLYVRDWTNRMLHEIRTAQQSILDCAVRNGGTIMPGFTHLQHGQPVFFAHHILAYAWMLQRDRERFQDALKRLDENPLGACALAGTAFPIDRKLTARLLGFSRVSENSIDTVADRDFIVEFVFACALTQVHLSRLAEELIIWSSTEFDYVKLADEFTSGSSIMPQKRNPDTAELLRGKTSRAIGGLTHLLTLLKGQPLAYNRDLQEDKPPLFDAAETTLLSVSLVRQMFASLQVNAKKMEKSCNGGFLLATELADYLARKGMPFREAHGVIKEIVNELRRDPKSDQALQNYTLEDFKSFSPLFQKDVFDSLSLRRVAERRNSYGGTGSKALQQQIRQLKALLRK
jgi:argininosuccinate lyase